MSPLYCGWLYVHRISHSTLNLLKFPRHRSLMASCRLTSAAHELGLAGFGRPREARRWEALGSWVSWDFRAQLGDKSGGNLMKYEENEGKIWKYEDIWGTDRNLGSKSDQIGNIGEHGYDCNVRAKIEVWSWKKMEGIGTTRLAVWAASLRRSQWRKRKIDTCWILLDE